MNNKLLDIAVVIEQSLLLVRASNDYHEMLKRFADQADSFQQYLEQEKDILSADWIEVEELRDRALAIGDADTIEETTDMCDRYIVDTMKKDMWITWNRGEIVKVKEKIVSSEKSVKYWNDNWKIVLVAVAEQLQSSRHNKAICCVCGEHLCHEHKNQCRDCMAVGCRCCVKTTSCAACGAMGCYKCQGFEECEDCGIGIYCFQCGGASYCPECEECWCLICTERHNLSGEVTCGSCLDRIITNCGDQIGE
jgi:hypothetical protein